MNKVRFFAIALLALGVVAIPAHGQSGEILFVFGSDTSTSGFDLSHPTTLYNAGGNDLYASPTGNGARVMADAFREQNSDYYGTPLKMTWWMQAGSLYRNAENTNVPLGSTMSPYRMRTYLGDAMERHGDEFTFHYHTWVWSDYDKDGRYWWNQALSFDESQEDFDRTMAQMLIEEDVFPVSFRSGWHFMDNAWQSHIDRLIPFSLHNDWPHVHDDTEEPTDNIYDWSRSPSEFIPFHPSTEDYQVPGDGASWNVRSIHFGRASETLIRDMFETARAGGEQVACIWSHLAEASFVDDLQVVLDRIALVAMDYPDVPFRYATAVEAMQRWLETNDETPPTLTVETISGGTALHITTDEQIFQTAPFVALKDRYERYFVLPVHEVGSSAWETDTFDPDAVAAIRVAVTDTVGNLSKATVRFLPQDLFVDNEDIDFETVSGSWTPAIPAGFAHVWGTDIHTATLSEGAEANARWQLPVTEDALYNVFVRIPDVENPAGHVSADLYSNGQIAASRLFEEPPAPDAWHFVGSAMFGPADAPRVELRAPGDGQAGAVLGADAIRVTALVRERQLALAKSELEFADVVAGEEAIVSVDVRNLGIGPLTISDLSTATGVLVPTDLPPYVIDGPVEVALAMRLYSDEIGTVRDTLLIYSDDPIAPVRHVPFKVTFRDWFVVADNDDAVGYGEAGTWHTSVTQAYGASSRYAFIPSSDEASFTVTAEQGGVYDASFIVPKTVNAAVRADYLVRINGVRTDSIRIDQNAGSGAWRALGIYDLSAGAEFRVTVRASDPEQPSAVLRADAFRLSRIGDYLQEIVLDDADGDHYSEVGPWQTSNAQAFGTSSRYASWGTDAMAVFHAAATSTGIHVLYEIVPETVNATQQARYRVLRNGGLVESLLIDQNEGSGSWRPLGAWLLDAGDEIEVEVSDEAESNTGLVLRADAVKLVFGGTSSTAVERELPDEEWSLGPNWPNPFAATTRFAYTLHEPGPVSIELYDVLGRRVAMIVDEELSAGVHEADFDASGLSSGVYVCHLRAGAHRESRTWTVAR